MNIIWPPEETLQFDAKNPTREKGVVITALPGGKPKQRRSNKSKEESR